jgi:4-hydroxy-tetrahydrodipicolinate reductase
LLARTLPAGFDAAQVETHHVTKADKPSGTARLLAASFAAARGGAEPPTHSLRLGGVVGEHSWTFSDPEETLTITHRAHSRRAFLRGIVPAVRFVNAKARGLFTLQDVLRIGGGGGADLAAG